LGTKKAPNIFVKIKYSTWLDMMMCMTSKFNHYINVLDIPVIHAGERYDGSRVSAHGISC